MSEPIKASTQYGDFKGTLSIDQEDRARDLLMELRKHVPVQAGFWPVAFRIHASKNHAGEPSYSVTLYATDADVSGVNGNSLAEYACTHTTVPVFGFSGSINGDELMAILMKSCKRLCLVAESRLLEGTPMVEILDS